MGRHVLFRTVAGPEIGFGHLRRCLTLAQALALELVESHFLVAAPFALLERITAEGFEARAVSDGGAAETLEHARKVGARVVVTDSYELTTEYHEALRSAVRVVAVDDLADRALPVDLVVNGSAGAERLAYRALASTRYCLGAGYTLLRPVFADETARTTAAHVRRVLVTTGGTDRHQLTPRLARWVQEGLGDVTVDVVIGPMFMAPAESWPAGVVAYRDPGDMRGLMRAADLALCAGGQTLYELAATGTPAVAVQVAQNQTANLAALAEAGTVVVAGDVSAADLGARVTTALRTLADDPSRRAEMSARGRHVVDGRGAPRVAREIAALAEET